MKKIKIKQDKVLDEQIDLIVDYLRRGKVIVYPTDTIYGLGCMATNKSAINKIYKIKKRSKGKPLLILVSSLAMVRRYCYVSRKQEECLRKVWADKSKLKSDFGYPKSDFMSRPVSVILKSRGVLPKELAGGGDSLAVRLPNSELLVRIIREVNVPIVSTSLNISGRKNLTNVSKIDRYFGKFPNPPSASLGQALYQEGNDNKKSPQPPFGRGGNNNKELPDLAVDIGELSAKSSKLVDLTDINNILVIRN